mgnify:CR=1 FL=1
MPLKSESLSTQSRREFCLALKAARECKGVTLASIDATMTPKAGAVNTSVNVKNVVVRLHAGQQQARGLRLPDVIRLRIRRQHALPRDLGAVVEMEIDAGSEALVHLPDALHGAGAGPANSR